MKVNGEVLYHYYKHEKREVKADLDWIKQVFMTQTERVKRPPDNPVNALISFGNTLLYTKTMSAIYRTHLDQRISYLHEPSEGRFSLSLDISEIFKPIIVFKIIFDLVNNRRIQSALIKKSVFGGDITPS